MTIAPTSTNSSATNSSTQRVAMSPRALPSGVVMSLLLGDEAGFLHQPLVGVLRGGHPVGVLFAGHERRVERRVLRVLLPFRQLADLLEDVDVVVDLVLRDAGRHEDAAQHRVLLS